MAGFQVTPDELRGVASQLDNAAGNVDGILNQVKNQVNALGDSWKGAAAGNFSALMADWTREVNELNTTLGEIARVLRTAAQNYEQTESANAQGFRQ
jgi:6 kDa early secretory antigenic target